MKVIQGDLIQLALEGKFDVIVHGCNCFCAMEAGIAKSIKCVFPEAYTVDCETKVGDREKLGSFSSVSVCRKNHTITVVNAYTQYHWSSDVRQVDYEALRLVFYKIKSEFSGLLIGYPKIGAGLAGGDWHIILKIIDEELAGEDHCLVVRSSE